MPLPLFALAVAAFAIGTTEMVIAGLLPALASDLSVDIPTAGLLISGYAMGVAIGGPFLAVGTARFPRKPLLLVMMVIFVIGNALCALATSYWLLMGARLVIAASHGVFFGVSILVASSLVPPGRQASAVSLVITGITVANVLGAPLGTAIGNAFGWRMTFWVIAGFGVLAGVAIAVLLPPPRTTASQPHASSAAQFRAVLQFPVLIGYAIIALAMTAFFIPVTFIVPILTEVTGISVGAVPWLLFVSGLGGIGGNLIGGRLGDWKPLPALVAIFLLETVLYALGLIAVYDAVAMTIVFFLWSLIGFSFSAPVQARILSAVREAPNLGSTLISTAYNIGIAAGAWLGGVALINGSGYAQLPGIGAIFLAVALMLVVFWLMVERRQRASALT